jgi:GNAT superfamily N-acetyltransferase
MLHSENAIFSISNERVDYYITRLLNPTSIKPDDIGPRGFIGVIGPVGALEGCIMLTVGSVWYSEQWSLDENFNFVDPSHRNSNHAKALISFAKDCADKVGVRLVIGVLSTKRTAAKVRLYERQLTPAGVFFMHPAPPEISPPIKLYRTQ